MKPLNLDQYTILKAIQDALANPSTLGLSIFLALILFLLLVFAVTWWRHPTFSKLLLVRKPHSPDQSPLRDAGTQELLDRLFKLALSETEKKTLEDVFSRVRITRVKKELLFENPDYFEEVFCDLRQRLGEQGETELEFDLRPLQAKMAGLLFQAGSEPI